MPSGLDVVSDHDPGLRQGLAEPSPQAFAAVKFQLQDGGAQSAGVNTVAAREVELVSAGPALTAQHVRPGSAGFLAAGLGNLVGRNRQTAARARGSGPRPQALPAIRAHARPVRLRELALAQQARGGKRHREKAVRQFSKNGVGNGSKAGSRAGNEPESHAGFAWSEKSLFVLFLALDAVASPRDGLQAPALDFLLTGRAEPVRAVLEALQRLLHKLKNATVIVALVKEEFLRVSIRGLVGNVLGAFLVRFAPILIGFGDLVHQLFLLCQQPLSVYLGFLLVHSAPCVKAVHVANLVVNLIF